VPTISTAPKGKVARDAYISELRARSDLLADRSAALVLWMRVAARRADVVTRRLRDLCPPGQP
jgi:hypothetical protein